MKTIHRTPADRARIRHAAKRRGRHHHAQRQQVCVCGSPLRQFSFTAHGITYRVQVCRTYGMLDGHGFRERQQKP